MLTEYIEAAMRHAKYEILPDDNSYYGEIAECNGVWTNESTLEACREDLRSALEDWLTFSLAKQLPIPSIDGIEIAVHEPKKPSALSFSVNISPVSDVLNLNNLY